MAGLAGSRRRRREEPRMSAIRVLLLDDHPLMREGIAAALGNHPDIVLVGEGSDGAEALALFRKHLPDVVLMDLQMPKVSGIEATIAIRAEFPDAQIIVLTAYHGDVQVIRALKAGAAAYLLKNTLRTELLDAVRSVHAGQRRLSTEVAAEVAEHRMDDALTERELDVLRVVAAGNSNKIVADRLGISEETVKGHMRTILSKLSAKDRTHAVTIALRRGIIDLP
jgi:DNA-binding NarL/FixJ family response regulator